MNNEEIRAKAKLYLYQYAEKIADQITVLNGNSYDNDRVFSSRGCVKDWYGEELSKRKRNYGLRISAKSALLKDIEILIQNIERL